MSLMDISKIFSLLQPRRGRGEEEDEEDEEEGERCEALHGAVSADDPALLSRLLSQEGYRRCIDRRSGWGIPQTPLRAAASRGHLRCLEVLLQHHAEVDSLDVKAQTPLFAAVSGKHPECAAALLRAGADPNGSPYNNCSPLLTAAREGDADVLRELLGHGAEVDARSKVPEWAANATACRGPLYISAVYGHLDCFKLLLLHGANPDYNCTDRKMLGRIKQPKTVAEVCLRYGCGAEYVRLLVDFGADVYLPALIVDKTTERNDALALLLKERVYPKTLMTQTRIAIRRQLPLANKEPSIERLDIPLILRKYLNHVILSI
ncbi:hypothetical protein NHX12_011766 [Muraenolepis orangiensis]|uniref:Ankyrin repeat and SOCS box protein 12 n=1 Tax=Muraenolepis orangiensis TaxID=630683 RepID=A0A9Q0DH31_9TELE|nr:hypothetical protein NHX12_011766 [Muraenolepis orangiensis]